MQLRRVPLLRRWIFAGLCFLFAMLALLAPLWPGHAVPEYLGGLLLWVAIIEIAHGFRRSLIKTPFGLVQWCVQYTHGLVACQC